MSWRATILTLFPEMFPGTLGHSLAGRALERGDWSLEARQIREFGTGRHRNVDDTPFGGGAGMVMRPEPWGEALDHLVADAWSTPTLVVPTPAGEPFRQATAHEFAALPHLVFACGRYEGIDARVVEWARERMPVREVSLGDYVLNGGEVAVLAMVEAIVRLVPGVVGNPHSLVEESHSVDGDGTLEYPVYTKPVSWRGLDVPEVLLSGNHARIASWRAERGLERTSARRPDLLVSDAEPSD